MTGFVEVLEWTDYSVVAVVHMLDGHVFVLLYRSNG